MTVPGQQAQGQLNLVQANKVLGTEVKNAQGQKIGTVENLALHTGQNRVQYAVLSLNEDQFQQSGDALFLCPWQSLNVQQQADQFTVTANISASDVQQAKEVQADWSDQLGNRPVKLLSTAQQSGRTPGAGQLRRQPTRPGQTNGEFNGEGETLGTETRRPQPQQYGNGEVNGDAEAKDKDVWNSNGEKKEHEGVYNSNGEKKEREGVYNSNGEWNKDKEDKASVQGNGNGETAQVSPRTSTQARGQEQYVLVSRLIGMDVKDQQQEDFAEVEGLVFDHRTGHVAFGIVSWGGFFGIGEQWALVPWNTLDFQYNQNVAQLQADRQTLTTIAFDPDQFPNLDNREYTANIYSRFNEQPYWTVYGYAGEDTQPQPGIEQYQQPQQQRDWTAWQPESVYIRQFNPETVTTVQGTIENIGSFYPSPNAPAGMSLKVQTQDGQRTVVNLGPRPFIMDQDVQFRSGDQVSITGSKVSIQGREVLVATQVTKEGQTVRIRDEQGRPLWDVSELQQGSRTGMNGEQQQRPQRGPLGTDGQRNGNGDSEHRLNGDSEDKPADPNTLGTSGYGNGESEQSI